MTMGRREFGVAGLSAAATLARGAAALAQPGGRQGRGGGQEEGHEVGRGVAGHGGQDMFADCAAACDACQRECDGCANHCTDLLARGHGEHGGHAETLRTCQDCADICSAAARIVARRGVFSADICRACADACAKCAEHCERHGQQDEVMKRCAEECRRCEEACRQMAGHAGHGAHPEHEARPADRRDR